MKERQLRQIEWLKSIVRFFKQTTFTNARVLHLEQEILAHYERVMTLFTENSRARLQPGVVRRKHGTKDKLREEQLLPLARRGRKLAREHPELLQAVKVPHKNASVDEIADAAERMAEALKPHLKFLIAAQFPRDCLTTLRRDARALRVGEEEARQARTLLGRSNRQLATELSLARQTVTELDAVLRTLDNYESFASSWDTHNRISARRGRPSKRRLAARARSAARSRARDDGDIAAAQ